LRGVSKDGPHGMRPSFEARRRRRARQDDGLSKTHSAAWRNMIAGGAANGYWALKSPSTPTSARTGKRFNRPQWPEPFSAARVNPHLIDSPDLIGLSPPPRRGRFSFAGKTAQRATLLWRLQLALKPALRPLGMRGSSQSHLAHSNLPGRVRSRGIGEPQCEQRES
jgi:hypothetical protein